jgi:heme A synthase
MKSPRRLAYVSLALAYIQIVFGAIVRITGSGMGCGDHWPQCMGRWFPPLDRADLIIEISHRYIASALIISIVLLIISAFRNRAVSLQAASVFNAAVLSACLVVAVAILGAVTVKLGLNPYIIVVHLSGAMAVLAALAATAIRAGGFGANEQMGVTPEKTFRAATAAVVLAFVILVMGALTANVAGAAGSCAGFPLCRAGMTSGAPLHIQLTHRILAFLLFFHMIGMVMAMRKRSVAPAVKRACWSAFALVIAQIFVAAAMVEMHLPHKLQSLHQAVGTLVWLSLFIFAGLARKSSRQTA